MKGIDVNQMAVVKGHHVVREKMAKEIKALRKKVAELEKQLATVAIKEDK